MPSALTSLSDTRPLTGNLCSRSNFEIASLVGVIEHSGRFDLTVAEFRQDPLHRLDAG